MRGAPALAAAAAAAALAMGLAACGDPHPSASSAGAAASPTAAAATTAPTAARTEAQSRAMAEPGTAFAQALTDRGIPAAAVGDEATLAQLARGICAQQAAGTAPEEIRGRLQQVISFVQSTVGGAMTPQQIADALLGAAHDAACRPAG